MLLILFRHSLIAACLFLAACATMNLRGAESMTLHVAPGTPADASVFIDENYIGPLAYVASHGVRVPTGKHRVTVEKLGYFPWDALIISDREPIRLNVAMTEIPN